jgi:hypothetical protein
LAQLSDWQHSLTANEKQLQVAAVCALNKTARWARTRVASETAKALSIKVGPVRRWKDLPSLAASYPLSQFELLERVSEPFHGDETHLDAHWA